MTMKGECAGEGEKFMTGNEDEVKAESVRKRWQIDDVVIAEICKRMIISEGMEQAVEVWEWHKKGGRTN